VLKEVLKVLVVHNTNQAVMDINQVLVVINQEIQELTGVKSILKTGFVNALMLRLVIQKQTMV
jgi:hypothetical protein